MFYNFIAIKPNDCKADTTVKGKIRWSMFQLAELGTNIFFLE